MSDRLTIAQIVAVIAVREQFGTGEVPTRPSRRYRIATQPTKRPYDFKRAKMRRKMAKNSRRINRLKKW